MFFIVYFIMFFIVYFITRLSDSTELLESRTNSYQNQNSVFLGFSIHPKPSTHADFFAPAQICFIGVCFAVTH